MHDKYGKAAAAIGELECARGVSFRLLLSSPSVLRAFQARWCVHFPSISSLIIGVHQRHNSRCEWPRLASSATKLGRPCRCDFLIRPSIAVPRIPPYRIRGGNLHPGRARSPRHPRDTRPMYPAIHQSLAFPALPRCRSPSCFHPSVSKAQRSPSVQRSFVPPRHGTGSRSSPKVKEILLTCCACALLFFGSMYRLMGAGSLALPSC